eukprot:TRINITY_DN36170_c0_g1_i1.p1 TRINITY_DN36170_c0_g1~~TRINITY_DN36170_c0_g1_i1.p1  ORF type:complete len:301 (+),score=54.58 TRINITY_DN36170_c0_g1_i1:26-904(+)
MAAPKDSGLSSRRQLSSKSAALKQGKKRGSVAASQSSGGPASDELLRRVADTGVSLASFPEPADDEETEEEEATFDGDFLPLNAGEVSELPTVGKAANSKGKARGASSSRGTAAGAEDAGAGPGASKAPNVLYIARIPHGFYEDQMAGFLGQFGTITRLRLSRNKKTGKSKHFAFVEFESPEVARIVAECMHNYLLFGSIVQCKLVPNEKLHPLTWVGANRKFRKVPWRRRAREAQNRVRSPEEEQRRLHKQMLRERRRRAKLAAAGIDYEFKGLESFRVLTDIPSHIKFDD